MWTVALRGYYSNATAVHVIVSRSKISNYHIQCLPFYIVSWRILKEKNRSPDSLVFLVNKWIFINSLFLWVIGKIEREFLFSHFLLFSVLNTFCDLMTQQAAYVQSKQQWYTNVFIPNNTHFIVYIEMHFTRQETERPILNSLITPFLRTFSFSA